jgi:hypothetical protein
VIVAKGDGEESSVGGSGVVGRPLDVEHAVFPCFVTPGARITLSAHPGREPALLSHGARQRGTRTDGQKT